MADQQTTIRPARVDDVPGLAGVHLASWLVTYRGIIHDAYLDSLSELTFEGYHRPRFGEDGNADPAQPFIVACDSKGQILGFARGGPMRDKSPTGDPLPEDVVRAFSSEMYAIYLLPQQHGRGIGRAMFDAVVRRLCDLQHRSMCVWVLGQNTIARRFYERMGGVLVPAESHVTLGGAAYPHIAYGWPNLPCSGC